jgi:cell division protein FtsQ
MIALAVYCAYDHFHDNLKDVDLKIVRKTEKGFIDYEKTYGEILDICDTVNNNQIKMINVDSVLNALNENPWIISAEAEINLKEYLAVEVVECEPIVRVYAKSGKSVYIDENGNIFPSENQYVPRILIVSGIDFPVKELGNVNDDIYAKTDLPQTFNLVKEVLNDNYAKSCVKQIHYDKKKNYIFSVNNTNIIVIFGDVNEIREKLLKMKHFFDKMLGNPELDNYKEINLNYKNQVVCTKIKK